MKILNFFVIALLIIGGLNWFLVGVFNINLVDRCFGYETLVTRIIYILVGLSALHALLNIKKHL